MKLIKKRWLSLAIAPALLALIGFATPANATTYTSCASVPPTVSGDADITDTACVFANDVSASGHISVTATSINATNLTASNGALTLTSSGGPISTAALESFGGATTVTSSGGLISTTTITSVYGAINVTSSGGDITTTDVSASGGPLNLQSSDKLTVNGTVQTDWDYIDIKADSDIDVDQVFSGWKLTMVSTNGKIIADAGSATADALKATNYGPMVITAKTTLDIIGVVSSINGDITLESDDDLSTKKVDSGNNLKMTSNNGKITSDGGSTTNDVLVADNYGNVQVKAKTSLTLTGKTTAKKWNVELQAEDDIKTNEVNSGAAMKIVSINGKIDIKDNDLKANTNDDFGNMLLVANKTIATKNLSTSGTAKTGGIEIQANKGTAPVPFIIGGSGNFNGINGTIDTTSTNGGGTDPNFISGGLNVTNGQSGSNGSITITAETDIKVRSTASRSGLIILNAQDGTITLPGGNALNTNGGTGGAGEVRLVAKTITFGNNATVSASQTTGATNHGIMIAAETINFSGGSGLVLNADGDGFDVYSLGHVAIYPKGSMTLTSTSNSSGTDYPYQFLYWGITVNPTDAVLNLVGGSNSPLKISANGSETRVDIRGNGTTFSGGDVTIEAKGKTNHNVVLTDTGSLDNKGLIFGGLGAVVINASGDNGTGSGASGGDVSITSDILTLNASNHTFKATGPDSGDGDGGTVYIAVSQALVLNTSSKMTINADAATSGSGNAVVGDPAVYGRKAIQFYPGQISADFGNAVNQYFLSAKGGANGGNGGTVLIAVNTAYLNAVTPGTESTINASAQGGDGDGGEVVFYSYVQGAEAGSKVNIKGHGTGKGGKFTAYRSVRWDLNKIVKVDGGDSITDPFDGSITLNGKVCLQKKLNYTPYPKTYWNCANTEQSLEEAPAQYVKNSLPNIQSLLEDTNHEDKVQLYVFDNSQDFNLFHSFNAAANVNAATYRNSEHNPDSLVYVSVFKKVGGSSGTPLVISDLQRNTAHEFGHVVDYILGGTNLLSHPGTDYDNKWAMRDFFYLDFTDTAGIDRRDPCADGPVVRAPFSDFPGICTSSGIAPAYANWSNSKIAQVANTPYIFTRTPQDNSWSELHANAFAYAAIDSGLPELERSYPNADHLIEVGYFGCTVTWGAAALAGAVPPSSSPSELNCGTAVPTSYAPGLDIPNP